MFGKSKNNNGVSNGKKYKPYRNRPSRRQAALEILSFLLVLAGAPAYLGGAISIFIAWFTLALGLIGLFAWTRRHAFLFAVLAGCMIALTIVNIILRATWNGQCLPFYTYNGVLATGTSNNAAASNSTSNTTAVADNTGFNNTALNTTQQARETNNNNANLDTDGPRNGDAITSNTENNNHNNSIWCGNNRVVYITNSIILLLSLLSFVVALSLLFRRKTVAPNAANGTTTTRTVETKSYATA